MNSWAARRFGGSTAQFVFADGAGTARDLDSAPRTPEPPNRPVCNRCGFVVPRPRARGCKNPCSNCGTVYPLGDCSD